MDPNFSSERLSLLDRGFVFAIAHIRGGTEMGKKWHDDGKMLNKMHTFSDFIASAEKLIKDGFTSPSHLAIMGAAPAECDGRGGQHAPRFVQSGNRQGAVCGRSEHGHRSDSAATVQEYEEWGNSNEKPVFDYIKSYSPYDNVKKQAYRTCWSRD